MASMCIVQFITRKVGHNTCLYNIQLQCSSQGVEWPLIMLQGMDRNEAVFRWGRVVMECVQKQARLLSGGAKPISTPHVHLFRSIHM